MKKTLYYLAVCAFSFFILIGETVAQVPESFLYQAEARDSQGKILKDEPLRVKASILQNGLTAYQEIHTIRTDENGLFSVRIGEGDFENDDAFSSINWGAGQYFLNIKLAKENSDYFIDMGTTQLLSVPYALYAQNAGNGLSSSNFKYYYPDKDEDGFGDDNKEVYSPVTPENYILIGGDCDDKNDLINPNAEEICDGVDNDCDGLIDEDFDLDNDGYSTCMGDCDDNNSTIYPNAEEISDNIDNNCDGKVDENFQNHTVKFFVDGKEWNVVDVDFKLFQETDNTGRPSSVARNLPIKMTVVPKHDWSNGEASDLFEWMCDSYLKKDALIVFSNNLEIEIGEAYMTSYRIKFEKNGQFFELIELSMKNIKIGNGEHENEWAI